MSAHGGTDAPSPLRLDARQRAMLEEMGVRVWSRPQEDPADANNDGTETATLPMAGRAPRLPVHAPPVAAVVPGQATNQAPPLLAQAIPAAAAPAAQISPIAINAAMDLAALRAAAALCRACRLSAGRQHTVWDAVPGPLPEGAPRWLFVLDAPGPEENATGSPVQGEAGQLLMNMAAAVGLQPQQVYRCHATKCAPAAGHRVCAAELAQCAAWLRHEMERVRPQLVLAMGRHAAFSVLGSTAPLGQLRGQPHRITLQADGTDALGVLADVPVVVTYAPAYLLRNPAAKRQAWQDLCLAGSLVDNRG
jgi:uracil-DNA glycosylase family 4